MAATVKIIRFNGALVGTDITSINTRALTYDTHTTNGTSNPIPVPTVTAAVNIASSTNATPIVITTSTAHTLATNDMVRIEGHTTNTNANGTWKVTVLTGTTFELTGRAGNGVGGATGTERKVNTSFWVSTAISATVAPTTGINNVKWYTDGGNTFGTGVIMKVGTTTTYATATGTVGTTGDAMNLVQYVGLTAASLTDDTPYAFAYTSGAPLTVGGSIGAATGRISNYVVYQVEVQSTAGPGVAPPGGPETLTFVFDET